MTLVLLATSAWAGARPGAGDVKVVPQTPPPLVAVLRPSDADADTDAVCQEIVTRIIAELMADGIPVVALTCVPGRGGCLDGAGIRVSAVVTVQRRDRVATVEVRTRESAVSLSQRSPAPLTTGQPVQAGRFEGGGDSGAAPAALAVRTVEFLKATALDGGSMALGGEPASVVAQQVDADPDVSPDREVDSRVTAAISHSADVVPIGPRNLTIGVGAVMLAGTSGLEHAYAPSLRLGRRTSDHVLLSLVIAGPSFGRTQHQGGSSAAVRHEMAALQADLQGLFWRVVTLRAGLGAGVYHVHVNGEARAELAGLPGTAVVNRGSGDGFAGLLSWSAGMVAQVRRDLGVYLEARMFVLTPTPAVLLNGSELGRVGNPGLAVSTGMEVRF